MLTSNKIKVGEFENEPLIEIQDPFDLDIREELMSVFTNTISIAKQFLYFHPIDINYLDSGTVGIIIYHIRKLVWLKKRLVMLQPSEELLTIFNLVGAGGLFGVRQDAP